MLLVFIISQIFINCLASPYHKYPFTFLLDVGNEELGKASLQQIKVSVPGGVLALKYPASGDGDIIGHIRVTGIDFGNELKVSIAEGGPGYRYVVLVLMGKPDMQYDAVVTIQTLEDDDDDVATDDDNMSDNKSYQVSEDIDETNNSAEDTDEDDVETKSMHTMKINNEISSLNNYVNEEVFDESNNHETMSYYDKDKNMNVEEFGDGDKNNGDSFEIDNSVESHSNENSNELVILRTSKYGKYDAFIPRILGGVRIYPQGAVPQDQVFISSINDEDDEAQAQSIKDFNNNIANEIVRPVEY